MILYHATYNAYLDSIFKKGLGGASHKNWDASTGDVCLALCPDDAESYAEVAIEEGLVPEDIYQSGITVLKVDATGVILRPDPNLLADELEEFPAWVYDGVIPPGRLEIFRTTFDY